MPLVDDSDPSHGFTEGSGIGFSYQTMNLAVEGTWMKAEGGRRQEGQLQGGLVQDGRDS